MTIVEREKVIDAYRRAIEKGADHAVACATVAQAFSLPVEAVECAVAEHEKS